MLEESKRPNQLHPGLTPEPSSNTSKHKEKLRGTNNADTGGSGLRASNLAPDVFPQLEKSRVPVSDLLQRVARVAAFPLHQRLPHAPGVRVHLVAQVTNVICKGQGSA